MALLNQNASSGDKFVVGTGNSTLGYNDITARINTHTHDGGDTYPSDARNQVESELVLLDYATQNILSSPTQGRFPRKITADMVNSAGSAVIGNLALTLNVDNTTACVNAGVSGNRAVLVPKVLQTTTNVISDAFTNTNNWSVATTGSGFFTAAAGNIYIGSAGVGTVRATYSATATTVHNNTMFQFNIQCKNQMGGGSNNWYHYITRANDSVTVAKFFNTDGAPADELHVDIAGADATVFFAQNDTLSFRITQANQSNLFVEFVKNNSDVTHAGYVSNGSTVNALRYNMSYNRTAAGTDSMAWDNFVVDRASGYQEGYVTLTANNPSSAESTNINKVYGIGWPYVVGAAEPKILQRFNYSASSDNGATWTTGTDLAWNNLTSTTGKQLLVRVSMGNNSSLVLKSTGVAWANASA